MEEKRRELEASLMSHAQMNLLFEKLRELIRYLQERRATVSDECGEVIEEGCGKLSGFIAEFQKSDRVWGEIEGLLDRLHPGFVDRLLERCPTLFPTEVKICMLARLGKETNEVAEILGNASRTVQIQRAKIRKKLKLAKDVNFILFIGSV
jgi:DNA-binding CsgD family transcriptional regulator